MLVTPRSAAFDVGYRHLLNAASHNKKETADPLKERKCLTSRPRARSRGLETVKVRIPMKLALHLQPTSRLMDSFLPSVSSRPFTARNNASVISPITPGSPTSISSPQRPKDCFTPRPPTLRPGTAENSNGQRFSGTRGGSAKVATVGAPQYTAARPKTAPRLSGRPRTAGSRLMTSSRNMQHMTSVPPSTVSPNDYGTPSVMPTSCPSVTTPDTMVARTAECTDGDCTGDTSYLPLEEFASYEHGEPDYSSVRELRRGMRGYVSCSSTWIHAAVRHQDGVRRCHPTGPRDDSAIVDRRTGRPLQLIKLWTACVVENVHVRNNVITVSLTGKGTTIAAQKTVRRFNFRSDESDEVYYRHLKIALERREECEARLRLHAHVISTAWTLNTSPLPERLMVGALKMLGFTTEAVFNADQDQILKRVPPQDYCFREFLLDQERRSGNLACSIDGSETISERPAEHAALDLLQQVSWFFAYSQITHLLRYKPVPNTPPVVTSPLYTLSKENTYRTNKPGVLPELNCSAVIVDPLLLGLVQTVNTRLLQSSPNDLLVELELLTPNDEMGMKIGIRHGCSKLPLSPDTLTSVHNERRSTRFRLLRDDYQLDAGYEMFVKLQEKRPELLECSTPGTFHPQFNAFMRLSHNIMRRLCEEVIERSLDAYVEFWRMWIQSPVVEKELQLVRDLNAIPNARYFLTPLLSITLAYDDGRMTTVPALGAMIEDLVAVVPETIRTFKHDGLGFVDTILPSCGAGDQLEIDPWWLLRDRETEVLALLNEAASPVRVLLQRFDAFQWVFDINVDSFVETTIMHFRRTKYEPIIRKRVARGLSGLPLCGFEAECARDEESYARKKAEKYCAVEPEDPIAVRDVDPREVARLLSQLPFQYDPVTAERLFFTEEEHDCLEQELRRLLDTKARLTAMVPGVLDLSLFQIDCRDVKKKLETILEQCCASVLSFWEEEALWLSTRAVEMYTSNIEHMSSEPQTVEELTELRHWIRDLRSVAHRLAHRWYFLTDKLLERLSEHLVKADEAHLAFWAYMPWPQKFSVLAHKRSLELKALASVMANSLRQEEAEFMEFTMFAAEHVKTLQEVGCDEGQVMDSRMVDDAFDGVEKVDIEMKRILDMRKQLQTRQHMLGRAVPNYPEVDNLAHSLEPFVTFWTAVQQAHSAELQWTESTLSAANYEEMTSEISAWRDVTTSKPLEAKLEQFSRPTHALYAMQEFLTKLDSMCPLVQKVRHPGFLARHWELLSIEAGFSTGELNMGNIRLRDLLDLGFLTAPFVINALNKVSKMAVEEYQVQSEMGVGFDATLLERWTHLHQLPARRCLFRNKLTDVCVEPLLRAREENKENENEEHNKEDDAGKWRQADRGGGVTPCRGRPSTFKATIGKWDPDVHGKICDDTKRLHRLTEDDEKDNEHEPTEIRETEVLGRFNRRPVLIHATPVVSGHCILIPVDDVAEDNGLLNENCMLIGLQWVVASHRSDFRAWFDSTLKNPLHKQLQFSGGYFNHVWDSPPLESFPVRWMQRRGGVSCGVVDMQVKTLVFRLDAGDVKEFAVCENFARCAFSVVKVLQDQNEPYHIVFSKKQIHVCAQGGTDCLEVMGLSVVEPKAFPAFSAEDAEQRWSAAQSDELNTIFHVVDAVTLTTPAIDVRKVSGEWMQDGSFVCTIDAETVTWPNGYTSTMCYNRETGAFGCELWLRGKVYSGTLSQYGTIEWVGGDVWTPQSADVLSNVETE